VKIQDKLQRVILLTAGIQTECKSNVLPLMSTVQLVFQLNELRLNNIYKSNSHFTGNTMCLLYTSVGQFSSGK
jgi:hypothetical protein